VDPGEHDDISEQQQQQQQLKKMLMMLSEAQAGVYSVDRGPVDKAACEAAMGKYEGFWGPWLE
jgi:hypothetical protein